MKMIGTIGALYAAGSGHKYQADENGIINNVQDRDVADLIRSGANAVHPETEKNESAGLLHKAGDDLAK